MPRSASVQLTLQGAEGESSSIGGLMQECPAKPGIELYPMLPPSTKHDEVVARLNFLS